MQSNLQNHTVGYRSVCTLLSLLLLGLSGCVEQSIVIKVLRDGTALIHVRSYVMPAPFSTNAGEANANKPQGVNETHVKTLLETLGPGVTVKSNENSKNSRGWPGTELILECEKADGLRLRREDLGLLMSTDRNEGESDKASKEGRLSGGPGLGLTFSLKENELNMQLDADFEEAKPVPNDRAQDPFDDRPAPTNPLELALVTTVMRELRLGVFVETEQEIAETNASYPVRNDHLITLFKFDGAKVDINKLYEHSGKELRSREEVRALVEKLDGFTVETKENVIVKLK